MTLFYVWSNKHTVNLSGYPPLCCTDLVCVVYQILNIPRTHSLSILAFTLYYMKSLSFCLIRCRDDTSVYITTYFLILDNLNLTFNVLVHIYEVQRSWLRNSACKLVTFHGFLPVRSGQYAYIEWPFFTQSSVIIIDWPFYNSLFYNYNIWNFR
jgi:hypothetical protein